MNSLILNTDVVRALERDHRRLAMLSQCEYLAEGIVLRNRSLAPDDPQNYSLLGIIALILTVVSTGLGTYASYAQSQQQKSAAKFNEKVAQNNATAAAQQAQYQQDRIKDRNRRLLGTTRAAYLKSGVELSGSAQDVLMDQAVQGEFDVAAAAYTGQVSSQNWMNQASLYRSQGRNAEAAGYGGMAGSVLHGAASGIDIAANPNFR